jgi:hypothetical protein
MADLSRNVADLPTVIIGATTAGVATTPVGADTSGNMYVNAQVVAPPTDLTVSGTLTSGSSVITLNINGSSSGNLDVSGTWVGTIQVQEVSASGTRTLPVQQFSSSINTNGNITANGNYRLLAIPTNSTVQVVFSSYTSGTANITLRTSTGVYAVEAYNVTPSNLQTAANLYDGSGNALTSTSGALNVSAVSAADTFVSGTITAQDTASTSTTYFNAQIWYSGTPTAGSVFAVSTVGIQSGMVEISGTWTGTLQTEVSVDNGVNWISNTIHTVGGPDYVNAVTNNVTGSLNLGGKTNFRVRSTQPFTGTATVRLIQSQNATNIYVANPIKLLDGSSQTSTTTMNIVPASTAVSSTNTAISVGLSPNSPLPSGTNTLGTVSSKTQDGSGNSIVSYNSQLSANDIINTSLSSGNLTVTTTAAPARVGSTNLANRKMLMIAPTTSTVYLGSSATTCNIPIYPGQVVSFAFSANVTPYLLGTVSSTVMIFEGA